MNKIKNVLIVDDNIATNLLHRKVVENYDNRIETSVAINGKEGLEHLTKHLPDIILMDLNMPVMDGFDFLKSLRDKRILEKTKVVVVTSSNDPSDRKRCLEITSDIKFMVKPLLISHLKEMVEEIENANF